MGAKQNWLVSVAALVHRLRSLDLISEWHYRTLCIQMSQLGYRKNEPEGIPRESSQVLSKLFGALRDEEVFNGIRWLTSFTSPGTNLNPWSSGWQLLRSLAGVGKTASPIALSGPYYALFKASGISMQPP